MELTKEQQDFLNTEGRIVLCAVPGSGKTFIVAKKLISYLKEWKYLHRGVAALSFTNVASDEIKRQITDSSQKTSEMGYPHFVGTLDSFINNFILLRFGYLMQKENRIRPIIIHENFGQLTFLSKDARCHQQMCTQHPEWFHWSSTGLQKDGKSIECDVNPKPCIAYKKALLKRGMVIQREVPSLSLLLLKKYPQIAKELAYRFPVIIVDEAQDTSREQMEILDCIAQAGVQTMVLVGDPDQSLYEWRDATPEYFKNKMHDGNWTCMYLSANFRSSQLICNAVQPFSSILNGKSPAAAKGECANYLKKPVLFSVPRDKSKEDNAGRDTGAIKQVGGQADDALDIALVNNGFADSRLRIATEQNTVGKNDRSLAGAFQGLQNMEQPRKVAVLFRRSVTIAIKAAIILKTIRPVFQRKRRIGHRKVETLQHLIIGAFFKIAGSRKCISCSDLTGSLVVQDKVHLGETCGSYFLFLSPNSNLEGGFIRCSNQK